MRRPHWVLIILVPALFAAAGCGRPTVPGRALSGRKVKTDVGETRSEAPKQPYFEVGPTSAKVRILAFFAIDSRHKPVIDVLKALAEQYPGKVYVKYVDPDTLQGRQIMSDSNQVGYGLLVNGQSSVQLGKSNASIANFGGEMGRYWTADILKAVVAQEVAKAYGK